MEIFLALIPIVLIGWSLFVWTRLWFIMFLHAYRTDTSDRIFWLAILILGGLLGGVLYFFAVYKKAPRTF